MAEEKKIEHHEQRAERHKQDSFKKIMAKLRANPWIIISIGLVLVILILIFGGKITGNAISEKSIGEKAIDYINTQLLQGQGTVTLNTINEKNGLYEVVVDYNGKQIPTYFTKDGQYFLEGSLVSITGNAAVETDSSQTQIEIPKSDKPLVELFVMTYCLYGLQAEKGIIPALTALGSHIDGKIRFVHYFMHGDSEEQETYVQTCIREEQPAKFLAYLKCFAEKGDSAACITQAEVDKAKVDNCVSNGNGKSYYGEDSKLSNGYGVQGSPTLVINGVQSSAGRDAQSYLNGICSAFNNAPSICSSKLSSSAPAAGFGAEAASTGTTGAATASCS